MQLQREEIEKTDRALAMHDGARRHLVRPPYGKLDLRTMIVCAMRWQRIALWTRDSLDYRLDSAQIIELFESRGLVRGDVVLFHDDGAAGREALRVLLPRWRAAGLEFGTL